MRKLLLFLLAVLQVYSSFAITVPNKSSLSAAVIMIPLPASNQTISLNDFLTLTPQAYKAHTGKRLGLKRTIEMKYAQKRLKSIVRTDGTVDAKDLKGLYNGDFRFHWGGFLLGFFFSIIGVLITLFFKDDNRRDRIISSTYGMAFVATLLLVAVRVLMAGM